MKKFATVVAFTIFAFLSNTNETQACGPVRALARGVAQRIQTAVQNVKGASRCSSGTCASSEQSYTPGQVGARQSGRAVEAFPKVRFGPALGSTCPGGVCPVR